MRISTSKIISAETLWSYLPYKYFYIHHSTSFFNKKNKQHKNVAYEKTEGFLGSLAEQ